MFNESITLPQAGQCLKSGFRMVSLGNITHTDRSQKQALVSASLWHGSLGSPVFVMRDSLVNIGYGMYNRFYCFTSPTHSADFSCFERSFVSGNASNNNVVHLYGPELKVDIDAAVLRIALMS
jgi:hypothetical protein